MDQGFLCLSPVALCWFGNSAGLYAFDVFLVAMLPGSALVAVVDGAHIIGNEGRTVLGLPCCCWVDIADCAERT